MASFYEEFLANLKRAPKAIIADPIIGAGKGALSTAVHGSEVFHDYAARPFTKLVTGMDVGGTARPEFLEKAITPVGIGQETGFFTEQLGEWFIPGGAALKAEKGAAKGLSALKAAKALQTTKASPFISRLTARSAKTAIDAANLAQKSAIGAGTFGGVELLQTGDTEKAKSAAKLGAAFPAGLAVAGKAGQTVGKIGGFAKGQAQKLESGRKFFGFMDDVITRARTSVQDKFLPARKLIDKTIKDSGATLSDDANMGLQEILSFGRTGTKLNEFEKSAVKPLVERLYNSGRNISSILEKEAKSLKDLPKVVGDNSTKIAALKKEAKEVAKNPKALIDRYLQARHAPERNALLGDGAAGLTNQEAKVVMEKLKQSPAFPEIAKAGQEVQRLATGIPKYLLDNDMITKEAYETLSKSYKNYVPLQRILPQEGGISQGLGMSKGFGIRGSEFKKAKGSDKPIDDILESTIMNWEAAINRVEKNKVAKSVVEFARQHPNNGVIQLLEKAPEKIGTRPLFSAKIGGKEMFVEVGDKAVLKALEGVGVESGGILAKTFGPITRFISSINTTYNPEFVLSNFTRDIQAAGLNLSAEKGSHFAAKTVANVFKSQKGVADYLLGRNTKGSKLYEDLMKQGGTTEFFQFADRKALGSKLRGMEKELSRGAIGRAIRSPKKVLDGIKGINEVVENGVRLSTYEQALKAGMSKQKAAAMAKEVTVNFNKKGELGSLMNSLYAFSNASIQGSFRTFKALKDPKQATRLTAVISAPTITTNKWNDEVDPEWRDKVPEYVRETNFVVMTSPGEYIKIPLPWGWNAIKVAADQVYDQSQGKQGTGESVKRTLGALANAYNPTGGAGPFETILPTALRPFESVRSNIAWHGGAIRPQQYDNKKESLLYYDSTNPMFIKAAQGLSELTGGEGAKPGLAEVSPEDLEYLYRSFTGGAGSFVERGGALAKSLIDDEEPVKSKIPFLRKFVSEVDEERVDMNTIYNTIEEAQHQLLPEDKKRKFLEAIDKEVKADRLTMKDAKSKVSNMEHYQEDLRGINALTTKFDIKSMSPKGYELFKTDIATKLGAEKLGITKFNKTQLKILDTFR